MVRPLGSSAMIALFPFGIPCLHHRYTHYITYANVLLYGLSYGLLHRSSDDSFIYCSIICIMLTDKSYAYPQYNTLHTFIIFFLFINQLIILCYHIGDRVRK